MEFLTGYASKGMLAERVVKAVLIGLAVAVLLGGVYYVFFRNWREELLAKRFFETLRAGDYETAYVMWGCSVQDPCRYYPFDEFLEDWGPDAPYGTIRDYAVRRSYTQANGVIVRYSINGTELDPLWVELDPPEISYYPN